MEETLTIADLTVVRKTVHLEQEGTSHRVTFDDLDLDPLTVRGSIFSIHRVKPNTYDIVLVVSSLPNAAVEEAKKAADSQRADAFESLELDDEDEA